MLDLEVEMPREPVIEGALFYVTRGVELQRQPWSLFVIINVHGNVIRLSNPNKPAAFQHTEIREKRVLKIGSRGLKWGLYWVKRDKKRVKE